MSEMLPDPVDDLLDVLQLRPEGRTSIRVSALPGMGGVPSETQADVFSGRSQPMPHGRVYGGQVLAQCLIAAGRTVTPVDDGSDEEPQERFIHSMHGYFLRPGDANHPLSFLVERMRDGRSFSARRVHAFQDGRILMSIIMSFQEHAPGLDHQLPMPQVPGPDGLPSDREVLETIPHPQAQAASRRPVEMRHVEPPLFFAAEPGPAEQSVWIRVPRQLPEDPLLHAAILAYASDYTLLEPILRRHGVSWGDPHLRGASLDHSMWYHRPGRVDDWILYTQSSPSAQAGRGLGQGHLYSADGTLLATVGQEGMVRLKD